jgi:uncharacterized protein YndB with AHSA1/START domain
MTTSGTFTITIKASPEVVWPWISQLDKHTQWSPKPYRVEFVSGAPNAVGARYKSVGWVPGDKNHGNEVEIIEVFTNSRFALRAYDEGGVFQNSYDLRPTSDGTEVTFKLVFPKMKGMSAILVPILFPLVGKADIRKRMGKLKARAEASR